MHADQDQDWIAFQRRFVIGQLVDGVVVRHEPFGIFVDIGSTTFLGLVAWPNTDGLSRGSEPVLPEVGSQLRCVLLAFSGIDSHQPRLSMRAAKIREAERRGLFPPVRVAAVAELWRVAGLPQVDRAAAVQRAFLQPNGDIAAVACWQVPYLPLDTRAATLRLALRHSDAGVGVRATWQTTHLRDEERAAFLHLALRHQSVAVAAAAVREVGRLPNEERAAFLDLALQHQNATVRVAAVQEVGQLPSEERAAFLRQALHDEGPEVTARETWQVRPILEDSATPLGSEVAAMAVWYVSRLAPAERAAFLEEALQHRGLEIRIRATGRAKHLTNQERLALLERARHDAHPAVVRRAHHELEQYRRLDIKHS